MFAHFRKFCADEAGNSLPEYAILLGLILAVSVAILTGMGSSIKTIFTNVSTALASAAASSG
ncbi:Flp family type IVb pilin [Rhodoblastus sp.]|uniref:Flp family type IVb pilin n=1 Tax=Rhodoblastus sp. TaxID=1962975 RepID=UPI003F96FF1C